MAVGRRAPDDCFCYTAADLKVSTTPVSRPEGLHYDSRSAGLQACCLGPVDQECGDVAEERPDELVGFGGEGRLFECGGHQLHPSVACGWVDGERRMADAQ